MSFRIRCYTLFDIEHTGISARRPPTDLPQTEIKTWELQRNKQCNLDTILQVISLRSQPEDISMPVKFHVNFSEFKHFGFLYDGCDPQTAWMFDFSIVHKDVFSNEFSDLGELFLDCDNVPMILTGEEWSRLSPSLSTNPELKNIHFEVITSD